MFNVVENTDIMQTEIFLMFLNIFRNKRQISLEVKNK